VAALVGGLLVLGFAADLVIRPGGHRGVVWVDDLGTLVAVLLALGATLSARRRAAPPDRPGWTLLAAGLAAWAFGEAVWGVYELGTGSVPFPGLADVGYLTAVPLVALGVHFFGAGDRPARRARVVLDGLVVATSVLLVSWVSVLGPVFRSGSGDVLSQAVAIAYPAGDVLIATMVLSTVTRARRFRGNPLVPIGLGLLLMAISDSVYAALVQAGTYTTGNLIDVGWVAAYLLIGLAALLPATPAGPPPPRDDEMPLASVLMPYAVLACAFGAAAYTLVTGSDDRVVEAGTAALVALIVMRQLVTLLDNRHLNAILRDKVAELGVREMELAQLAFRDPLTGLPNRAAFLDAVDRVAAARETTRSPLAVLFLDLDDFKAVNDTLGHDAGDALLAEAAERLRSRVGSALAARLGGDEFGVLLDGDAALTPVAVAGEIHEELRRPFALAGGQMIVRASIGIAQSAVDVSGPELLRQADIAMYAAKRRGKGLSQVFGPDLADGATERILLRSALASALDADALDLHYQPIVELVTGRVWGVEALSRWSDAERGLIPPAEFIPLSEESGLIHQLGRLVLRNACEEASRWPGGAAAPLLSVNVSALQLADAGIIGAVSDALAASGLPPDRLMIEVSEAILHEPVRERLEVLRDLGIRVAIDDFGTGSSSLQHLARFPVDVIKIDQSLVRGIDEGAAGLAVLRAIVELADQLGIDTVGEGIEEIRQADALASVGCRSGQGFWYRRPVPAAQLWPLPSGAVLRPRRGSGQPV